MNLYTYNIHIAWILDKQLRCKSDYYYCSTLSLLYPNIGNLNPFSHSFLPSILPQYEHSPYIIYDCQNR